MADLTIILGFCAFLLLISTFLSGLLFYKFHVRRLGVKAHCFLAVLALVFALAHFLSVLMRH